MHPRGTPVHDEDTLENCTGNLAVARWLHALSEKQQEAVLYDTSPPPGVGGGAYEGKGP
jgi:hypothetical protein